MEDKYYYYRYEKMDMEQFAIFEENFSHMNEHMQDQVQIHYTYDYSQNIICCSITNRLIGDNDSLILVSKMNSYFSLQPQTIKNLEKDGHIIFPQPLLIQFASLNYGALRGALYLKTQSTPLAGYILAPIYLEEIIKEPFAAEMK